MNNLTDMDNLSTNRAARKLVELALISFLGACHNGTDVGLFRIHFLSALVIFFAWHWCCATQRWVGSLFRSSDRPSESSHTAGEHVTTCRYHSRLFSCVPGGQLIPDLRTHQHWLRSPFADLHTPLRPVRSPESDGEIGLISRVNLYMLINTNVSGLHVPFWFEGSLSKNK